MARIATSVLLFVVVGANVRAKAFDLALSRAAIARTQHAVTYDGSYRAIAYPGGDVPDDIGVCTDLVIRAYRLVGVDLQQLVHEDMTREFDAYPSRTLWGLSRPDPNIDHRRVPNLRAFLARNGTRVPVSEDPDTYRAGDLVTWSLEGNLPHIGIVSDRLDDSGIPLVVHNIGAGPKLEDVLFAYTLTGHYRYQPGSRSASGHDDALTGSDANLGAPDGLDRPDQRGTEPVLSRGNDPDAAPTAAVIGEILEDANP